MLRFACFVTGDDYNIVKTETPESKKKVSALASVIFIPAIIWFANGFLLVQTVLQRNWYSALLVGIFLSVLIFLIERNIIMAHNNRSITIFRYALGVIIALLGAICLDEAIFKQDIDQQLFEIHKSTIDESTKEIEDSYRDKIQKIQTDVDSKYIVWQKAINEAKREADGTGGSGIKGVHAITRIKLASAEVGKVDYENTLLVLNNLKRSLEDEKIQRSREIETSFQEDALLNRIKALFALVTSDVAMGIIYFLFTALLFFMEFLVVFLKSAWLKTNYERKLEMIEEIGRKRMEKLLNAYEANRDPFEVYAAVKRSKELLKNSSASMYN